MRQCEICGRTLPEEDFSKSYKKRCKDCVAEMTRKKRVQINQHIDPVLIKEPIVIPSNNSEAYWRTLRHEYAGRLLVGILASARFTNLSSPHGKEDYAKMAVSYADILIEELKKSESHE